MLLDFTFNPFALISLFTSFLVVGLIIYILRQQYQTATLRWLVVAMVAILQWSLAEFFIRSSGTAETAKFFKYWEMAGYTMLGPAAVALCLAFVGKEHVLKQWRWMVALFVPAILLIFGSWTQNLYIDTANISKWHLSWYGEWSAPLSQFFTTIFVPWLNILLLVAVYQLFRYYRQQKDPIRRRAVLIFALGISIPAIVGLITDQLWQAVTGMEMLEMATLTMGFSAVWITYGIIRYQLFDVNPAVIATNILSTMKEVVIVCRPNMDIEFTSQPIKELLGYESHDLLGQPLKEYIKSSWSDAEKLITNTNGTEKTFEVQMRTKDNNQIPVGITVTTYKGNKNKILAYVLVLVDLRQIQELFHITEERNKLDATLSSMTDGVIGIMPEGQIGLANQAFYSMVSVKESQVLGQKLENIATITDSTTGSDVMQELRTFLTTTSTKRVFYQSVTLKVASGDQIETDIIVSKLPKEKRNVALSAILTIHNVTKERQLERMKADFTMLAAHELRTPITSIRGYTHILLDEVKPLLKPEQQQIVERLDASSERLGRLVDQLLEVSAIEQGRLKVTKEVNNLVATVDEVLAKYQERAQKEKWLIESTLPPTEVMLSFDSDRIKQVLEILLDNAVIFSAPNPRVGVIMRKDDQRVVLSVVDNGQGILPELQQSLFEPYSRRAAGMRQTNQGASLNLHIAKSIIELHDGTISVKSKPGKGSVFTIELPLSPM